jgi:hypothetical protein
MSIKIAWAGEITFTFNKKQEFRSLKDFGTLNALSYPLTLGLGYDSQRFISCAGQVKRLAQRQYLISLHQYPAERPAAEIFGMDPPPAAVGRPAPPTLDIVPGGPASAKIPIFCRPD